MNNFFILGISLLSLGWEVIGYPNIEWRYLDIDQPICDVLQGAVLGGDDGKPLYVCRAWSTYKSGHWVPGKLFYEDGDYFCQIEEGVMQHEHGVSHGPMLVQVLFAHYGCLSWVPKTSKIVPPNAVLGGSHPAGEEAHICCHLDSEGRVIIENF